MIKKRIISFAYAGKGIQQIFATQINFRMHCLALMLVVAAGAYFNVSRIDWILLAIASGFVLVTESLNTALEYSCDAITKDNNENIRIAKDAGAAAVLISSIVAIIVGVLIFSPKVLGN